MDADGGRMMGRRAVLAGLAALPVMVARRGLAASALPPVDLALVMAIDCSASISAEMLAFQKRGHAAAFRDPVIVQALAAGPAGRVAVMLAHFSEPGSFTPFVPWTALANAADARGLADRIDAATLPNGGGSTALGSCVVAGVTALDHCPYTATRRTIDVVSNGFNNAGLGPLSARGYASQAGVTVNALVILDEYPWLESYYRDNVMAGDSAFVMVAADRHSFAQAFRAKLVAEIA